ncbi:hypothetical protein SASPL_101942 [Salvia splendens]|uniref:Uncharacterized protein n=1 Tax=Salvia splendens TaxID=180675 RepID=A0A8X8YSN9_SALSN|nr:hypothetical protein SASPL_101942 [Salvia splendens]
MTYSDCVLVVPQLQRCLKHEHMHLVPMAAKAAKAPKAAVSIAAQASACATALKELQDPNAHTMRHKAWPLWDDWKMIFGNYRATGGTFEGIGEAVANNFMDEPITSIGESGDYYSSFEDFLRSDQVQPTYINKVVDDNSAQSGQNVAANTPAPAPKKMKCKRKSSDADSALLNLLGNLNAEANARLDKLTARIGYEIDLGQARKEIFRHLGNIPELTESQRYDLCDIIGKENSRLEIFTGLPDALKPGYVRCIIEKEGLT